jgi:glycerol-3-phosphate dehydrogenase
VLDLARRQGVDVPITGAVEAVCFRGLTPHAMLEQLMSRSVKSEGVVSRPPARDRAGSGSAG